MNTHVVTLTNVVNSVLRVVCLFNTVSGYVKTRRLCRPLQLLLLLIAVAVAVAVVLLWFGVMLCCCLSPCIMLHCNAVLLNCSPGVVRSCLTACFARVCVQQDAMVSAAGMEGVLVMLHDKTGEAKGKAAAASTAASSGEGNDVSLMEMRRCTHISIFWQFLR